MGIFNIWNRKCGYTLAELLIVLGVVGFIAIMIIIPMTSNITQQTFQQEQNLNIEKIREATNQMRTNEVLDGYTTNDAFVDEFQKYIKISQRCDSSHLQNCFISKFTTDSGDIINLSDLTAGTNLGQASNLSSTVGIILLNGTTMILAFDPNCARIDPFDNTIDTTSCMAIVYDINGFAKPNEIGKDISLLNATISTCDGKKIGSLCVATANSTYTPILADPDLHGWNNYWAGARDKCISLGMRLPTLAELNTMYLNKVAIGGFGTSWYWSSTEYSGTDGAWVEKFSDGSQGYTYRDTSGYKVRCVK